MAMQVSQAKYDGREALADVEETLELGISASSISKEKRHALVHKVR